MGKPQADLTDYDTRTISTGRIRGRLQGAVATFLGLPYAAPPIGALRYARPQPPAEWTGVRDALEPGPSAPQSSNASFAGLDMTAITGATWRRGGDYLTLNVWAPPSADRAPVMVYIHGGGLVLGTKDAPVYSGASFARDGIVAVNINYRLGAEGFLPIQGVPTNLGLRDMIAALHWVQENIAAFGGDPTNVTIFGESGGGIATACLITSPLTHGLFQRAIVQSGHGSAVYPIEIANRTVNRLAHELKIAPTADGFRSATPDRTITALAKISRPGRVNLKDTNGFDPSFGLGLINPVYGDDVLPQHPLLALAAGAGGDVDLLIGTTSEEARFWSGPTRLELLPRPIARWLLARITPNSKAIFDTYSAAYPRERGGATLTRVLSDLAFRWPARQFAAAHQGRTWMYEFAWRSPAANGRLGAAHGIDLAFVFDTLNTVTGPHGAAGLNPPQPLADHTHNLWASFARTGALPWASFSEQNRWIYQLTDQTATPESPLLVATFDTAQSTPTGDEPRPPAEAS